MRKKSEYMTLACVLTAEEKAKYSADLAQAVSDKAQYEAEMDSFRTQHKAQISACDQRMQLCADRINTGKEFRSIECEISYDFENRIRRWFRKDTGEEVKTDIIPESELQEEANL